MATWPKLLAMVLFLPFQFFLIWGVMSEGGVDGGARIAREVMIWIAPVYLVLLAGVGVWFWIQRRALQSLSVEEQRAVKAALRSGEGWRMAVLLPLIAVSHQLPLIVAALAFMSFVLVSSAWLASRLARLEIPRGPLRACIWGQGAVLIGMGAAFGLMLGMPRP